MIMTKDRESMDLVKAAISAVRVAEHQFRAWAPGDKGKYETIVLRLPQDLAIGSVPSGKILAALAKKNGIPEGKWKVTSTKVMPHNAEKYVRIQAEDEVINIIRALDGILLLGAISLEVHQGGSRLSKSP